MAMVKYAGITPIERMGDYWVKREDLACWSSLEYPSGSKVRQYMAMATKGIPCIVGCSANSCMAIYVAATAKQLNTKGIIYTAARKKQTDGIKYALEMGSEVVEVKPGYLSLIRSRARARTLELGECVRWSPQLAIEDTIRQCLEGPPFSNEIKRIIVPTGSGLTAAGVIAALSAGVRTDIKVVIVATSSMADHKSILKTGYTAARSYRASAPEIETVFIPPSSSYNKHEIESLPDGTPLDPFYSAKAFKYLESGDLFWPVGLRPVRSMPKDCQIAFKNWEGPKE